MASDLSKWQHLQSMLIKAGGMKVRVGVFNGLMGADGDTPKIATIHEFGAPRAGIPERSFMRSTFRERKQEIQEVMAKLIRAMIAGKLNEVDALNMLGAWLSNAIKTKIVAGPFVPNTMQTILRKGSSKPLIDTAQLKNSVTWVLEP